MNIDRDDAAPEPSIIPTSHINPLLLNLNKDSAKFLKQNKSLNEVKIVYFGTDELSAYILERLILFTQNPPQLSESLTEHSNDGPIKYIVQAVITRADQPVGRNQTLTASPVSQVAQKYSIPTLKPTKLNAEFINNHQSFLDSELFIVVSYGKIIPKDLLEIPTRGSLNVHPSLLPKYRGPSPIKTAILNGDEKTGVTIMLMDEEMDHGAILSNAETPISKLETNITLSEKLARLGADLLLETLPKYLLNQIEPLSQNHAAAVFCAMIKKEDGYFEIDNPPPLEKLDRMIRAYYPWPGVWTVWREKREAGSGKENTDKGKIIKFFPEGYIQMEGKNKVKLEDFLHGYPDFPIKKI